MAKVLMYSSRICPYCQMAERLLASKGVDCIDKVRIDLDASRLVEMLARTKRRTVPQIFIGDHHVGGFEDLVRLDRNGELDRLLES